ncbi:MAG: caspase family protein [Treponemataceae bacterium]|nr:caspase family protein [Treponema sp.]MDE6245277.1 caspase family protein [Treponemataceae bacterium]
MGKKALVIGIDDYPNCPLAGCVNDAKDIATLLERNEDGSKNFDVRLETQDLKKDKLLELIETLFSKEDETALLYFSGHGDAKDYAEYICATDFSPSYPGVKLSDILELVNNSKCKNKVVILDSCFSGGMGDCPFSGDKSVLTKGLTILSASRNYEPSMESKGHGVFTHLLIEALKGGAADLLGHITPGSIYAYIDKALGCWEQRPVFKTNIQEFISLRETKSPIAAEDLRALKDLFPNKSNSINLDPSFEYTNNPKEKHEYVEPYSNENNVKIFKQLQRLERVGLVEPVDAQHMYFAAMNSKSCKLTSLGLYYKTLAEKGRF